MGKWFAAVILYACLLLATALNFGFLFLHGNPDWKPLAVGYLGVFLQGGLLLALGTFISTLTKNQIIAGTATFGICLLPWVIEWVTGYESATWATVLAYFSAITHFDSFARGVIDSKDLVFYLTEVFLGLFATARRSSLCSGGRRRRPAGSKRGRPNTRPTRWFTFWWSSRSWSGQTFLSDRYNKSFDATSNKVDSPGVDSLLGKSAISRPPAFLIQDLSPRSSKLP